MVNFSDRLKELRKQAGLTQGQLAEKIWVTKATICYYEQSERNPSPEVLIKLANVFHVSTDYLLGIDKKQRYLDISDLPDEDVELLQHTVDLLRRKNENSK